jgi:hypothetical protein
MVPKNRKGYLSTSFRGHRQTSHTLLAVRFLGISKTIRKNLAFLTLTCLKLLSAPIQINKELGAGKCQIFIDR